MLKIGTVKFVQVQRSALKVNEGSPDSYYDPSPILVVDRLRLAPEGAIGITSDDLNIIDVHNSRHSRHRNNGTNAISVGFTPHYNVMQACYGNHIFLGAAGENIIIEAAQPFTMEHVGKQVAFQSSTTQKLTPLTATRPIAPCQQFSKFCTQNPQLGGQAMKETLQFLSDGRRGFMLKLEEGAGQVYIQAGDEFFILD